MIQFKRNRLSDDEIDSLIERYYEGLTTTNEEKRLTIYLSSPGVPEKYHAEKAIFGYLNRKKHKPKYQFPQQMRWVAAIAGIITIAISIQTLVYNEPENYAFIDGNRITDKTEIATLALNSISEFSTTNNDVEESLVNIDNNSIVSKQLEIFSEIQ